jgi:hypothetical protein
MVFSTRKRVSGTLERKQNVLDPHTTSRSYGIDFRYKAKAVSTEHFYRTQTSSLSGTRAFVCWASLATRSPTCVSELLWCTAAHHFRVKRLVEVVLPAKIMVSVADRGRGLVEGSRPFEQ